MSSENSIALGTDKPLVIAIAGVPNSGKTTVFNALTGLHYKVANYPGVTVEKREGATDIPGVGPVTLVDLPGTYNLLGGSPDEHLASEYLLGHLDDEQIPDVVICVADAGNLERNLYLLSQLMDCGRPVLLALNMTDIAERRGIRVHTELLKRGLDLPIVDITRMGKEELGELRREIVEFVKNPKPSSNRFAWCPATDYVDTARELGEICRAEHACASACADPTIVGMGLLSGARTGGGEKLASRVVDKRQALAQAGFDPGTFEPEKRHEWLSQVIASATSEVRPKHRKLISTIDRVVTHKFWGSFIFLALMLTIFHSVFSWAAAPMDWIDAFFAGARSRVAAALGPGQLTSMLTDGVIAGAGSVLVFVPQIAILFFFLALLEGSGYLARAAFLMDNLLRRFGLQGRSFIPLLSSFACAVPGIMCTRSIPSVSDRIVTILVAPLMSCSARLPVYTLLIAAFVPNTTLLGVLSLQGLLMFALYFLGIAGAALVALLFKRTAFRKSITYFVMEMPPYRLPKLREVLHTVWDRVVVFFRHAGTVIMLCALILWVLASYPRVENAAPSEALRQSFAGQIGAVIEPVIRPLGFDWKIGVSIVASFAAREVFVSSMALIHNLEEDDPDSPSLISAIRNAKDPQTGKPLYTPLTAIALMVFYVFSCQCMSTLAVCKRETGSWKWSLVMFVYMTLLAYFAALTTYQVGSLIL